MDGTLLNKKPRPFAEADALEREMRRQGSVA